MNTLYMMCGLPGSGKSLYAKEISKVKNAKIYSSDELRKEMFGNVSDTKHNSDLFQELHKRIKNELFKGKNVIYDATNLSHKRRKVFLDSLKKI